MGQSAWGEATVGSLLPVHEPSPAHSAAGGSRPPAGPLALQIDHNAAVDLAALFGPVIHPIHAGRLSGWRWRAPDQSQQGLAAAPYVQPVRLPATGLTTSAKAGAYSAAVSRCVRRLRRASQSGTGSANVTRGQAAFVQRKRLGAGLAGRR